MDERLQVAFVCTGNRARSPLAEALYRRYSEGFETEVTSYGTSDVGAAPPLSQALEAGAALGIDLSGHRARPLRRGDLAGADLVLGFEAFHQAVAVIDAGAAAAKTFLLAELVPLLDEPSLGGDDVTRTRAAVSLADSRRIRTRPAEAASLGDPLGQPDEVMFRTARQIDELVRELVRKLFG